MGIQHNDIIKIIQASYDGLYKSDIIDKKVTVTDETHLLGGASDLDSIGFITLFADIEECIMQKFTKDIYLVLDEISEFDVNSPFLTAGILASYIADKIGNIID